MKNYKVKIVSLMMAFMAISTACDDILDTEPLGQETGQNYLNDPINAEQAVNAVYDVLHWDEGGKNSGHTYEWMFGDVLSDDADKGSKPGDFLEIQEMSEWRTNSSHGITASTWNNNFHGIYRANFIIENMPNATIDEDLKSRLIGEAYFLRGYYYLYLTQKFGGLPLFDRPVEPGDYRNIGTIQRATLAETLAFIVESFDLASPLLPEIHADDDLGRATSGASRAYKARTMIYEMGVTNSAGFTWQQVLDATDSVIGSGVYSISGVNFAQMIEDEGENGINSVFEVQNVSNNEGWGPIKAGTTNNIIQANRSDWGWGFNNPTQALIDSYETGDPRIACTVYADGDVVHGEVQTIPFPDENSTGYLNRKAAVEPGIRSTTDGKDSPQNVRKMRYADVLLMNAEAAYHTGDATKANNRVNQVRQRAKSSTRPKGSQEGSLGYVAYSAAELSGVLNDISLSGTPLLDAIHAERRCEFAMEGQRFYEMVRTGIYMTYIATLGSEIEANCTSHLITDGVVNPVPVLAIPLNEVQSWGLAQNPGY